VNAIDKNQLFNYRVSARVYSAFPGAHAGQIVGTGHLFKRHMPLIARPDPRRIDLRASVLDPFEQYKVRVFQQPSQLTVYLIADLSASMSFHGNSSKQQVIADCLVSVAESAAYAGDRFGFIGCSDSRESSYVIEPQLTSPGRFRQLAGKLCQSPLQGRADELQRVAAYLPRQPALVFLLSDFYLSVARIEQLAHSLQQHFIVPLVLWDKQEYAGLPEWGSMRLQDMETGRQRTLFLRPALKQKIISAFLQRKKELQQLFRRFGYEPLFLEDGYHAPAMEQYFSQYLVGTV